MSNYFIISVRAPDRVGMISEIAQAIRLLDGDIDDLSQSVLKGYFTMILLVAFPENVTEPQIKQTLEAEDRHIGLSPVSAEEITAGTPASDSAHHYILTASGRDRMGIVADVTSFCAQHKINILDLTTKRTADEYVMMCLVDLKQADPLTDIRWRLKIFIQENGLRITLQHQDIFQATGEV